MEPTVTVTNFVLTPLDVQCDLPQEIVPHHILRRATEHEIGFIREIIGDSIEGRQFRALFEEPSGMQQFPSRTDIPSSHRYLAVDRISSDPCKAVNQAINDIQEASRIVGPDLYIPLATFPGRGYYSIGSHTGAPFLPINKYFPRVLGGFFDKLTSEYIAELQRLVPLLNALEDEPEWLPIRRSFTLFRQVEAFSVGNVLYPIGLFAVMESLISRSPKAAPEDSITHQVLSKTLLLERRMESPPDYSIFKGCDRDKVWRKLYSWRSRLAHGEAITFAEGDLAALGSVELATGFLLSAVRAVLKHSLTEPDLLLDLRKI